MLKCLTDALRFLTKSPGFTLAALMTLALGIGATTIVFSVLYAVVLRPLPYDHSQRLVWVWSTRSNGPQKQRVSYPDFMDWMAQSQTLESWAGWGTYEAVLTGVVEPQRLQAALVMGNLFMLLGVRPQIGALAGVEKVDPQEPTVVLSHDFWEQSLNSDPAVFGRRLTLNGLNYTVAAVMPAGFRFPIQAAKRIDLWIPLIRFNPLLEKKRDARLIEVLARLRSNVALAQAQAEMDVIASRLRQRYPETNQDTSIRVVSAVSEVTAGAAYSLWILFASVGALLLIACANIANLQMARAMARERDISIRRALGASRTRIAAQVVGESLILAVLGGVVGFLAAVWGVRALGAFIPSTLPRGDEIGVNGHVLGFALLTDISRCCEDQRRSARIRRRDTRRRSFIRSQSTDQRYSDIRTTSRHINR